MGQSISLWGGSDLPEQSELEKFMQNCMDSNSKLCTKQKSIEREEWKKVHYRIEKEILAKESEQHLSSLYQSCHVSPKQCSKGEACSALADYYQKKIRLGVVLKKSLEILANELTSKNSLENNQYVMNINNLQSLLNRLCIEDQKTIYLDGKSVKQKIINEKPVSLEELNSIEREMISILSNSKLRNKLMKLYI